MGGLLYDAVGDDVLTGIVREMAPVAFAGASGLLFAATTDSYLHCVIPSNRTLTALPFNPVTHPVLGFHLLTFDFYHQSIDQDSFSTRADICRHPRCIPCGSLEDFEIFDDSLGMDIQPLVLNHVFIRLVEDSPAD